MVVMLHKEKYAYFSVPKCACTSLKHFFFEIENGFRFKSFHTNGKANYLHDLGYESVKLTKSLRNATREMHRVAVVRDPIARVLSCYSNRVVHHKGLDQIELTDEDKERGLTRNPPLGNFIRNFSRYRVLAPSIAHHSRPLAYFLGGDPSYFHRIYDISELKQLADDFRQLTGGAPELRHLQTGGPKIPASKLNEKQRNKIQNFFAQDYELYGDYFVQKETTGAS